MQPLNHKPKSTLYRKIKQALTSLAITLLVTLTLTGQTKATEGLVYTLISNNTAYSVTGYTGTSPEVVIPETYLSKPVINIGENAFKSKDFITSVTIPAGVTSIGLSAFQGCTSLTSIHIPEGVTSIGPYAFQSCSNLTSVTFAEASMLQSIGSGSFYFCSSLTSINIPAGVTSIGNGVFSDCSNLVSIYIPEGVTSISSNAFNGCYSLTSIHIPEGVTSIGDQAFLGCSSLASIVIPEGITSISFNAFKGCSSLTSINIPEGVTNIGNQAFYDCSSLASINIPAGVTSIDDWAFYGCTSLTSIHLPEGVTSIGSYAFHGCTSLTSIHIPEGITSIESWTFHSCSNLTSVTFAEGSLLQSIGINAFNSCTSLTSINIPAGVTSIGSYAFRDCSSLTSVVVNAITPPSLETNVFYANHSARSFCVPPQSVDAYKTALNWSTYASRISASPIITGEPQEASVSAGQPATFTITAQDATEYSWEYRANSTSTWEAITNSNSPTYTTPTTTANMDGYQYRCVAINACGESESEFATLSVVISDSGCATTIHPRWNENATHYGTDNFGLNFLPGGICAKIHENFEYGYFFSGNEINILVHNPFWNTANAQMLTGSFSVGFEEWYGSGTPAPKATQNSALSIRACKDYTGSAEDGTLFTNAYVDGDGNYYDAVKVGSLLWINENLKTTKFQDGTPITLGESASDFENNVDNIPLYTFYNYPSLGDTYKNIYGGLYNWHCVKNGLLVNGDGWRVCTGHDLKQKLQNYLINTNWCDVEVTSSNVGQFMKSCRQVNHPNPSSAGIPLTLAPVFTQNPTSANVNVGELATFTITAGNATEYRWEFRTSSTSSWEVIPNSNTPTYTTPTTTPEMDNYQYRCVAITGDCENVSEVATLSVINTMVEDCSITKYGFLYNWYAAVNERNICSEGYRIPSFSEFETLIEYLGGEHVAGGKLKAVGYEYWEEPNVGAINTASFNALGAGYRIASGVIFINMNFKILTKNDNSKPIVYTLNYNTESVSQSEVGKHVGLSLRPMRSATIDELNLPDGIIDGILYTDPSGISYPVTKIGTQVWVAENIRTTKYQNGDWIRGYDNGIYTPISWSNIEGSLCAYNDDESNVFAQSGLVFTEEPINQLVRIGEDAIFKVKVLGADSYQWQKYNSSLNNWDNIEDANQSEYLITDVNDALNDTYYRCIAINSCGEEESRIASLYVVDPTSNICYNEINYGYLYNQFAINDFRNIVNSEMTSIGWSVPSFDDFYSLSEFLGDTENSGGKLKENSMKFWYNPNVGATNEFGFNGRGSGLRSKIFSNSYFTYLNKVSCYWTQDGIDTGAGFYFLNYNSSAFTRGLSSPEDGMSVRLFRTATELEQDLPDGTACANYIGNDGKVYRTVKIGTQVWTADNLAETKYANGDQIPNVPDNLQWATLNTGAFCAYNNDESNAFTYTGPQFTQQPVDITVNEGETATFTVTALGATSYQWYYKEATEGKRHADQTTKLPPVDDWVPIPGATTSSYSINEVTTEINLRKFKCVAQNDCGETQSEVVTLTVQNAMEGPLVKYGYLYNSHILTDTRSIVNNDIDEGIWHIPTSDEWVELRDNLGGWEIAGGKLKGINTTQQTQGHFSPCEPAQWSTPNTGATDQFNFAAYPGGDISWPEKKYSYWMGSLAKYWAIATSSYNNWIFSLSNGSTALSRTVDSWDQIGSSGNSIRLVRNLKDNEHSLANGHIIENAYLGNDGKIYRGVKLFNKVWIAENLAETQFYSGDPIQYKYEESEWVNAWNSGESARGAYLNDENYALYLVDEIVLLTQPEDTIVCAGSNTSFSVTPSGVGFTLQWQLSTNGGSTWINITNGDVYSGANSQELNITYVTTEMDTYRYQCVVSSCSPTVTSNTAILTVNQPPSITSQPQDASISVGQTASFTITAIEATSYQWYSMEAVSGMIVAGKKATASRAETREEWVLIPGATGPTYTPPATTPEMDGYQYRCVAINENCESESEVATLTVISGEPPTITLDITDQDVCENTQVFFTVEAEGATGYQWQSRDNTSSEWFEIQGENASTLSVMASAGISGRQYRCVVSGEGNTSISSAIATLTISPTPSVITQPNDLTVCEGIEAELSVVASTSLYQWLYKPNGETEWIDIEGENQSTLVITATSQLNQAQYQCRLSNRGCSVLSGIATLTVTPIAEPEILVQPNDTEVCEGSSVTFTISAVEANEYQWQRSEDFGITWTDLAYGSNQTQVTFAATADINQSLIRCVLRSNNCSQWVYSTEVQLTVNPLPNANFHGFTPGQQYCSYNEPITLNPEVNDYPYTEFSGPGIENGNQFNPSKAGQGTHLVTLTVTDDNGCSNTSSQEVTVIHINPRISLTSHHCIDSDPIPYYVIPNPAGNSYVFEVNKTEYFNELPVFNPQQHPWQLGLNSTVLQYTHTESGCTFTSPKRAIYIHSLPKVSITASQELPVCEGTTITLTANVTEGTQPYTYKWFKYNPLTNGWVELGGQTQPTLTITPIVTSYYKVQVADRYSCGNSADLVVEINPKPQIEIISTQGVSCPTSNDGHLGYRVNFELSSNINFSLTPHNNLDNHSYPIEIKPNGNILFTDLSMGNHLLTAVSIENGCEDNQTAVIPNWGPVFEDVCPDAVVCSNGNGLNDIRVRFLVTRKQPIATGKYSYRIVGPGVDQYGTGQFGSYTKAFVQGVTPGSHYEIHILKTPCLAKPCYNNECDVTPFRFMVNYAHFSISLNNPDGVYKLCGSNPVEVSGNAIFSAACNNFENRDLEFRLSKIENDSPTPITQWTAADNDLGFTFNAHYQPGLYAVDLRYKGNENCIPSKRFTIIEPSNLNVNLQLNHVSCFGGNTGEAIANVSGNYSPVSFKWFDSNGQQLPSTLAHISGLSAGEYSVVVTENISDQVCAEETTEFVIAEPEKLDNIVFNTDMPCEPFIEFEGGTPSYTVYWYQVVSVADDLPHLLSSLLGLNSSFFNLEEILNFRKLLYTDVTNEPFSQPEKGVIVPGKYIIKIVDANGCTFEMDEPYEIYPNIQPRTFLLSYRWNTLSKEVQNEEHEVETTMFNIEVNNSKDDIANAVDKCVESVVNNMEIQLDSYCTTLDSLDDKVTLTYTTNTEYNTLYLTDRAGNLTRTIAPEEYKPLDENTSVADAYGSENSTRYFYNNMGQLVKQTTPDGGETNFIYNNVGQLRFSQNAQQLINNTFSYTKYDALGRVREVGECDLGVTYNGQPVSNFNDLNIVAQADSYQTLTEEEHFPVIADHYNNLSQRTVTVYNTNAPNIEYKGSAQRFLRNRVSYTYTVLQKAQSFQQMDSEVRNTTYYSYDPHGNVEWLVQEKPVIGKTYIAYEYDLISGNVIKVSMNEGRPDAFFHRYEYDEDNRLRAAYTSTNGYIWDKDANYQYYAHGPLKRLEIGQDRIQALDYAYTLQGWLKAINHPSLTEVNPNEDDGFVPDKFGMVLNYHQNDFVRNNSDVFTQSDRFALQPGINSQGEHRNLYNGNISTWVSSYRHNDATLDITGYQYTYDKLNRILAADFNTFNQISNTFEGTSQYGTSYTYDLNGNIQTLNRKGNKIGQEDMDDLEYFYYEGTNRLSHVIDNQTDNDRYEDDIESQNTLNYIYDAIGNLIRDEQAQISIKWNVYGKVAEVVPNQGSGKPHIVYTYDASGNRVSKQVNTEPEFANGLVTGNITNPEKVTTTYYLRDASGNTMAIYERVNIKIDNTYQAIFTLAEVPLYGSDRLGMYKPDINNHLASIPFDSAADFNNVEFNMANVLLRLKGTQTWVVSSKSTKIRNQFLLNKLLYNETVNTYALAETDIVQGTGTVVGRIAVAESPKGKDMFYLVPASTSDGSMIGQLPSYQLKVYNANGNEVLNSKGINFNHQQQLQVVKALGSNNLYIVFTTDTKNRLLYHVVDMDANKGEGEVVIKNQYLLKTDGFTSVHTAMVNTHTNSIYLLVAHSPDGRHTQLNKVTLGELTEGYEFAQNPQVDDFIQLKSLGINSAQLSANGTQLLLYHLVSEIKPGMYNAEVSVYSIGENLTLLGQTLNKPLKQQVAPGGQVTFSANATYALIETRAADKNKPVAMLKYNLRTNSIEELSATPGNPQLYADGNVYVSQTGTATLQAYNSNLEPNGSISVGPDRVLTGYLSYRVQTLSAAPQQAQVYTRPVGYKQYELKDHLGNVRALVADTKTHAKEGSYTTPLEAYFSYYPFGSTQPGRFSPPNLVGQGGYRFGFNGKEKDDEWHGSTGTVYDYGFRIYDTRIARFLSVDPLTKSYPWYTPYQFAGNKPIIAIDLDGLEELVVNNASAVSDAEPNLKIVTAKFVAGKSGDIGKQMVKWSNAKVEQMLSDGYLKASNGKIYKTSRMTTSFVENLDGLPVQQVNRGVNFGFKMNGKVVTTKGVSFSTPGTNFAKYGGKILVEAGTAFAFADLFYSFYSGGNPVSSINPLGFAMDNYLNELDNDLRMMEETVLSNALDKGYDATVDLLKSSYSLSKRYDMMDINQETLNMISEGKITNYNDLLDASYNTEGDNEYSIMYSEDKKGNLQIRAGFLKPKD